MAMEYFSLFPENLDQIEDLTMEERGQIFTALMQYAFTDKEPDFEPGTMCRLAWRFLKPRIDAAAKKSGVMAENGRQGGRPKKQTESQEKQTESKRNLTESRKKLSESKRKLSESKPKAEKSPESESEAESDTESESDLSARAREEREINDLIPWAMTGEQVAELNQLTESLTDVRAVVQYAVEEARKYGGRSGAYLVRVLRSLIEDGVKGAGDIERRKQHAAVPAQQYTQREYRDENALPDWVIQKGIELGILEGGGPGDNIGNASA